VIRKGFSVIGSSSYRFMSSAERKHSSIIPLMRRARFQCSESRGRILTLMFLARRRLCAWFGISAAVSVSLSNFESSPWQKKSFFKEDSLFQATYLWL
jgi:hypothetical protein